MISVQEALNKVVEHIIDLGEELIHFETSMGRVLAEDVLADRDFPPFNRASMDGIVIKWEDFQNGERTFNVVGEQMAGSPSQSLQESKSCLEIMTGAVVPDGASVVIRYEDVVIQNGIARVEEIEINEWANIHRQGIDAKGGEVLIEKGKLLNVGDIGILASVGKSTVKVKALPKVALISTGDELVEVDELPLPHQIRKSNLHTLGALLSDLQLTYQRYHFNDNEEEIRKGLTPIIQDFDVILMSGGVSKGKRDYVPEMLEELGINKHFHRVAQRPGKPLWFGSNDQVTVFGFPGNPVSTLVCFQVYFREWLAASLGIEFPRVQAKLSSTIHFKPELTYFVPVHLNFEGHELIATPFQGHGSGDLVNLSQTDGFIELPSGIQVFNVGGVFRLVGLKE